MNYLLKTTITHTHTHVFKYLQIELKTLGKQLNCSPFLPPFIIAQIPLKYLHRHKTSTSSQFHRNILPPPSSKPVKTP